MPDLVKIQRRGSGALSSFNVGSRGELPAGDSRYRDFDKARRFGKSLPEGRPQHRTAKSSTMKGGKLLARKRRRR